MDEDRRDLFPRTPPVKMGADHIRFLTELRRHDWRLLQKNLTVALKLPKTRVSEVKADLVRLGWLRDVDLGGSREILVTEERQGDVDLFLSRWQSAGRVVFLRPHHIEVRCLILRGAERLPSALQVLNHLPQLKVCQDPQGPQVTIYTPYGRIGLNLQAKNPVVRFWLDDFPFPVNMENLNMDDVEYYIEFGISRRLAMMYSLLEITLERFRVKLHSVRVLRELHLGILLTEDAVRVLKVNDHLLDLGLEKDHSVPGCLEYEAYGDLQKVLEKIRPALELLFGKLARDD